MANHKFGFSNGVVKARYVNPALVALTASGTDAIDLNAGKGEVFKLTPTGSANINASGITANVGQRVTLIILTSGTNSYTMTFNTNFLSTGTLATGVTSAKTFVVDFVSNGTKLIEVSRTTAM
jgi:hypothetical protein